MRSVEPHMFRATPEAWLGQLLLPLTFFTVLTVTAVNSLGLNPWIGGIGLMVLILVASLNYVLPMLRNWVQLDNRAIEGSFNGRYFHIYWSEVLATWVYERSRRRFLCLGTRDGTLVLPLRFLDDQSVWDSVRISVSPAALSEDSIHRLPDYRAWETARSQVLQDAEPSTVTDHWLIQVIGWSGMTFFLFGLIDALGAGMYPQVAVFGLLIVFSGLMLLSWGLTEVNNHCVERYTLFGGWRIAWDEVRWIEVDPLDMVMVLVGDHCQLVITGPGLWAGANKKAALAMLLAQSEKHRIPVRRTPRAVLKISYRTKARK